VIGEETRAQLQALGEGAPDILVACVGGGSNAIGFFHTWIDAGPRLIGVEAAGLGVDTDQHAATLTAGTPGVLHGARSLLLQDDDGQVRLAHSVSAGLDYPGVGPEHAWLQATGKAEYVSITDDEAVAAFKHLSEIEGIIPALESAHAIAHVQKMNEAGQLRSDHKLVVCLSGRGDKDVASMSDRIGSSAS
jgi:tryptophan synthase beta chain